MNALRRFAAPLILRQVDQFGRGIAHGSMELTLPDGSVHHLGGQAEGPHAVLNMRSWRARDRLALSGSSGWYEAWAAGEWDSPDPVQVFAVFSRNRHTLARAARARGGSLMLKRFTHWLRRNHRDGARRNIEYHYDLGYDFYAPWLDPGMTYSSAIDVSAGQSLEEAQAAKLEAMLARTATKPGDTILEIGCGWGSFAEAAGRAGRKLHGITLSKEQKSWAEARIALAGIADVDFALTDYRDVTGTYDAVVSIEMVEAVGQEYWPH